MNLNSQKYFNLLGFRQNESVGLKSREFIFSKSLTFKTWFNEIQDLCSLYNLPSCSEMLEVPIEKEIFKKTVKNDTTD